eukprot:1267219-Prymnesium_polylepis.2
MLTLVLEELLSNCRKYRELDSPIFIGNQNKKGTLPLSYEECKRVFQAGYKSHNATLVSSGVGLDTVAKAVAAMHGDVWLSTRYSEKLGVWYTLCHVELPAGELPVGELPAGELPAGELPAGQLRGCPTQVEKLAPQSSPAVHLEETDSPASSEAGSHLELVIGLDDDPFMRILHGALFSQYMPAAASRSLGATDEDIDAFAECALGIRCVTDLQRFKTPRRQADVLVIDQNVLRPGGDEAVLGTDLTLQLREQDFRGVICILTASSAHETDRISALPGGDLCCEKGMSLAELAEKLLECCTLKRRLVAEATASAPVAASGSLAAAAAVVKIGVQAMDARDDEDCNAGCKDALSTRAQEVAILDLGRFDGLPPAILRSILLSFYSLDDPCSASACLTTYETDLSAGRKVSLHRFIGTARSAGAAELADLAEQLGSNPCAEDLRCLRKALERAHATVQRRGLMPTLPDTQT